MLITLSIIQSLNGLEITNDGYTIKFFDFSDRIWCEITEDSSGEILKEGQITNLNEFQTLTRDYDLLNNWDEGRTVGLIVMTIMKSESPNT
jgi:hypothetical protein